MECETIDECVSGKKETNEKIRGISLMIPFYCMIIHLSAKAIAFVCNFFPIFFFFHSFPSRKQNSFAYYSFRPSHKICTAKINSKGYRNILFHIIWSGLEWSKNAVSWNNENENENEKNQRESTNKLHTKCTTNQNKTMRKRYKTKIPRFFFFCIKL